MARSMPSMVALLGLLAVAGYQNRDKLGAVLGGLGSTQPRGNTNGDEPNNGLEDILGGLSRGIGGLSTASLGSILSGGLGELLERFNGSGQGGKAQSWIRDGANEEIGTRDLEASLGAETIDALQQHTGLSKDDLLARLAHVLPEAVDRLTPTGRLPTEQEASRIL